MTSLHLLSRERLLSSLKGKSAILPDMLAVLRDWPRTVNPELGKFHRDVEKYLETCVVLVG